MKFITKSGSVYEINTESKEIRRLNGKNDPTPRQGPDGQWRKYVDIFPDPVEVGKSLVIRWGDDTKPLPETPTDEGLLIIPTTVTSPIQSLEN